VFAKVVLVIVALGICACSLLALRQARLQTANELAEARLRVRAIDERVAVVRTAIAGHVTPEQVEDMTRQIQNQLEPLALRRWRPGEALPGVATELSDPARTLASDD